MWWSVPVFLLVAVCAESRADDSDAERNAISAVDFYAADERLRALVLEALEKNPSVRESFARYRAALEKDEQVSALADPMFTYNQAIRSVETRVGPQLNTFMLSQAFPWFGELDLRGQVALQEAYALAALHRARQREVIRDVKLAYYELAYIDRALAIAAEERSLLDHYERLAQARYASGDGLQQGVIRLQLELSRLTSRIDLLEQQREELEASLNTLLSRAPNTPVPPVDSLVVPDVELDQEALEALGLENRPELEAAEERIERSERAIELAQKVGLPDFVLGVGFVNVGARSDAPGVAMPPPDNGKNALTFSAGISLPLWRDKYAAGVREASETLLAERSGYASVRDQMELAIREQIVRLRTLRDQIGLFDGVLVPQAEESLRATEAAYETGQLRVLDLLDGERVLLSIRLALARFGADYLEALARLERAVGTQFPR